MRPKPSRILLVWGHGHNFGHLARLGAIAEVLRGLRCQVCWSVPASHLSVVRETLALSREPVDIAPVARTSEQPSVPQSFADVLVSFGFAEEGALHRTVGFWLHHFASAEVDGVVLDYAPEAQLAALIARCPAVQITNGFDAPPPNCPTFRIGVRGPMIDRKNEASIARIDVAINLVAKKYGVPSDTSLANVLAYPSKWFDCAPQADPYGPREGNYIGPVGKPRDTVVVDWPTAELERKRVFVYLRQGDQVRSVLDALASLKATVICAWPATLSEPIELKDHQVVVNRPVSLSSLLHSCDAVVNYGSSTLVSQCLLAGVPQLMLPTDVEKWLVSSRVAGVSAGVVVRWPAEMGALRTGLARVLTDPERRDAARSFAGDAPADLATEAARFVAETLRVQR